MNYLNQLSMLHIPITWATIRAGFEGVGTNTRQLVEAVHVAEYADKQIGSGAEVSTALLGALEASQCDRDDVLKLLRVLAPVDEPTLRNEKRKFVVVLLMNELARLPLDVADQVMAIEDFWLEYGLECEMPSPVRRAPFQSAADAQHHFSAANARLMLAANQDWVEREVTKLSHRPT